MPAHVETAEEIMARFASLTGLTGEIAPQRYLWTDAFAVCNYLELYRRTGDEQFLLLARRLVGQVHEVLGHHREDDPRSGWLSGLGEEAGEKQPTRGGLRIGKRLPERRVDQPYNRQLEWDREGQYYHYLTRWMHALNRVGQVTGEPHYNRWARELAETAHAAFVFEPPGGGPKLIYWKMSVDLGRPLVPSMGQHDPLDGYLTFVSLQLAMPEGAAGPDLTEAIAELAEICVGREWVTSDALGLGGLLADAHWAARLVEAGALDQPDLPAELLDAALVGLHAFAQQNSLRYPASHRLAFRELGLAIGLQAADRLQEALDAREGHLGRQGNLHRRLNSLRTYLPLAETIVSFWLDPAHRTAQTWLEHRAINMVMLATAMTPASYLALAVDD